MTGGSTRLFVYLSVFFVTGTVDTLMLFDEQLVLGVFRAVSLKASGHAVHAHVWFKYGMFERQSYLSIRYY